MAYRLNRDKATEEIKADFDSETLGAIKLSEFSEFAPVAYVMGIVAEAIDNDETDPTMFVYDVGEDDFLVALNMGEYRITSFTLETRDYFDSEATGLEPILKGIESVLEVATGLLRFARPTDADKFVRMCAELILDGEDDGDGGTFVMENDDAVDCLSSIIGDARAQLGLPSFNAPGEDADEGES